METIRRILKKIIPARLFALLQPTYHYVLAAWGAMRYGIPSQGIFVIGITGTKGKSSTTEILNALLEGAGKKTGMVNGIRFKIGDQEKPNRLKMTMPGRSLIQKYIAQSVEESCDYFILEMTSEGTKQFRHKFIELDSLIFTNLSPEHIESHGSYEKYVAAKLSIAQEMLRSKKRHRTIIANADDAEGQQFLSVPVEEHIAFKKADVSPLEITDSGISFVLNGQTYTSPLRGEFNFYNILAAVTCALAMGLEPKKIAASLAAFSGAKGRVQQVEAGQNFEVVVDYAHTADSLKQFYDVFRGKRTICILGSTGGGRDQWKRPEMGGVADTCCDEIILTNEDPYDEDPQHIIDDVAKGIVQHTPHIILDRREAIAAALRMAQPGDAVLITGKGTDPYIMEANGKRTPWDDARIAHEELIKLKT